MGSGSNIMRWRQLPPHPGGSRWAPGSFVMRGTARAYFTSGYDRNTEVLHSDVWMIDLSPLFQTEAPLTGGTTNADQQSNSGSSSSTTTTATSEPPPSDSSSGSAKAQDVTSDATTIFTTDNDPVKSSAASLLLGKFDGWRSAMVATLALPTIMHVVQ